MSDTRPRSLAVPVVEIIRPALEASGLSYRALMRELDARGTPAGLTILHRVLALGRATSVARAESIADALGVPVGVAFTHPNGDPIGGTL